MLIQFNKTYYLMLLLVVIAGVIQYAHTQQLASNNSPQGEVLISGNSSEVLQSRLSFTLSDQSESNWQWQDITVKNNTDNVKSFNLSWRKQSNDNKLSFLSWTFPEVVSVPANTSVIFALTMASDTNHPKLSQMFDQAQQIKMVLMLTERNDPQVEHLMPVELHFSNEQHSS